MAMRRRWLDRRIWTGALAAALAGAGLGTPALAQFSAAYNFLKAVRDADGAKANELVSAPGSTIVNSRDPSTGESGLHIAVKRRDMAWIGFLLSNHGNADIRDNDGNTPLAAASQIGYLEGAQILLQVGAQPNLPNNRGETPLIIAVQMRNLAMVRLLIAGGADPRIADHVAGQSAYDYAKADPRGDAVVRVLDEARPKAALKTMGPSQ